jgi:hypothetical protein
MTCEQILGVILCGTDDQAAQTAETGCEVCPPKMVLTHEEEAILATMRQIKDQVRPISERMNQLRNMIDSPETVPDSEDQDEWRILSNRLEQLRTEWKAWEYKLEEAIDPKLENGYLKA